MFGKSGIRPTTALLALFFISVTGFSQSVSAFSSREIIDAGKIAKPNYFNKIQRSVVGVGGQQISGTVFDIETDGGFVDALISVTQVGDKTSLPVEGNINTGTGSDSSVGGTAMTPSEISAMKNAFVLKLKNKNGQIENFSILDKKFYEFVNFITQNVKNEDLEVFVIDTNKQLDILKRMSDDIRSQLVDTADKQEILSIAETLSFDIIDDYQAKLTDLSKTASNFDAYISTFSANYGLAGGKGKILTRLNNPFSFSTVSYGSILTQISSREDKRQSTSNVTIGMRSTQGVSTKSKPRAKNVKVVSNGGVSSGTEVGYEDYPETPPSSSVESDAVIIGRANSMCASYKSIVNPGFPSRVESLNPNVVGGRAKDISVIKPIYLANGNSFAGKKDEICVKIPNQCWRKRTNDPDGDEVFRGGSMNGETCTKNDTDGLYQGKATRKNGVLIWSNYKYTTPW